MQKKKKNYQIINCKKYLKRNLEHSFSDFQNIEF